MKPREVIWADEQKAGPFDGVLIVMNIGKDDGVEPDPLPQHYFDSLSEAVAMAHARGHAVVYVFDKGIMLPRDELGSMTGMDFYRLMHEACGKATADFDLNPDRRNQQFIDMVDSIFSHGAFTFVGKAAKITGICRIDGCEAIVPVTTLKLT